MTDQEKNRTIFQEIQVISKNFREKYPIFAHQDAIGAGIMISSLLMIVLGIWGYANDYINAWFVMIWIAFWTSLLHELEHDLIHYLYFKKNPIAHHLMMLGTWIFRPMTVSPWFRRYLHLHHHKYSGLDSDLEERAVTNGEKWGFLRLLITPDQILSFVLRAYRLYPEIKKMEKEGKFTKIEIRNLYNILFFGFLPFGIPLHLIWYGFVIFYALEGLDALFSLGIIFPLWAIEFVLLAKPLVIILVAPNLFRQFCLHFITSNLHYYGDIERGNALQQTQVLNVWWTFPFQLFCFNFGTTHAIHHFWVQETFYIRQFTSKAALEVMRKYGVRFNDLGTFKRANRFHV